MIYRFVAVACAVAALAHSADEPFPRQEFDERISQYLKLRKKAAEGIPKLNAKAEPEQIQARKLALAQSIRSARPEAKQGTVFAPAIQQYVLRIVRSEMRGKAGVPAKKAAKEGNPPVEGHPVAVKVNGAYPDSAPVSTVPATLLLRLPELPKELDFRFVGRHLILRDAEAGIIIDFISDVIP